MSQTADTLSCARCQLTVERKFSIISIVEEHWVSSVTNNREYVNIQEVDSVSTCVVAQQMNRLFFIAQ